MAKRSIEYYRERKQKGLCVNCSTPLEADENVLCTECREKRRKNVNEIREIKKKLKLCPRCGKNKLFGDEANCPECRAYATNIMSKWREVNKEHYNEVHKTYSKKITKERREKGLCTRCGKRKADGGYVTCGVCRDKNRKSWRNRTPYSTREERVNNGGCYFCENKSIKGLKVCEIHHKQMIEKSRSQKAVEARKQITFNYGKNLGKAN